MTTELESLPVKALEAVKALEDAGKVKHPIPFLLTYPIGRAIKAMTPEQQDTPPVKLLLDFITCKDKQENIANAREFIELSKKVRSQANELKRIKLPASSFGDQANVETILDNIYLEKMQDAEAAAQKIVKLEDNITAIKDNTAAIKTAVAAQIKFLKEYKGPPEAKTIIETTFGQPDYIGISALVGKMPPEKQTAIFLVISDAAEKMAQGKFDRQLTIEGTPRYLKMSKIADIEQTSPALINAVISAQTKLEELERDGRRLDIMVAILSDEAFEQPIGRIANKSNDNAEVLASIIALAATEIDEGIYNPKETAREIPHTLKRTAMEPSDQELIANILPKAINTAAQNFSPEQYEESVAKPEYEPSRARYDRAFTERNRIDPDKIREKKANAVKAI